MEQRPEEKWAYGGRCLRLVAKKKKSREKLHFFCKIAWKQKVNFSICVTKKRNANSKRKKRPLCFGTRSWMANDISHATNIWKRKLEIFQISCNFRTYIAVYYVINILLTFRPSFGHFPDLVIVPFTVVPVVFSCSLGERLSKLKA